MKDALGDRMKSYYEDRLRYMLPRRTNTIIRIDGKAFHTYTKGLERPFDAGLIEDMDKTTEYLCKNIQGAKFGYVQSDEISILITDYDDIETHAWFDNNLQKMTSVAASMATAKFNQLRMLRFAENNIDEMASLSSSLLDQTMNINEIENFKLAMFDARCFQIPHQEEVINYFIWRQQDATRNSISSVAQSLYSHKELHGKKTDEMQEMIFQKGINWNDYTPREKRGGIIKKFREVVEMKVSSFDLMSDGSIGSRGEGATRTKWRPDENTPIFIKDREYLKNLIPK